MPNKKAGISINSAEWEKFYTPFAAYFPNPMIDDLNNPGQKIPQYATEELHVTAYLKIQLRRAKVKGIQKLKSNAASEYDAPIPGLE